MNKTLLSVIIIILVIVAIALLIKKHPETNMMPTEETTNEQATVPAGSPTQEGVDLSVQTGMSTTVTAPKTVTISYTDNGYVPSTVSINAGDTVKFMNNSSRGMWTASDPHPVHTDFSAFDARKNYNPGESYSFTFTTAGTYGFHNHTHSSDTGEVIVK